jgi:predicted nucleotidyltransferase
MGKGYAEGPAAEEAEARLDALERGLVDEERPEERLAVFGATDDEAEPHFIGWLGEVDPDELFTSGRAWGITVRRRAIDG